MNDTGGNCHSGSAGETDVHILIKYQPVAFFQINFLLFLIVDKNLNCILKNFHMQDIIFVMLFILLGSFDISNVRRMLPIHVSRQSISATNNMQRLVPLIIVFIIESNINPL